MSNKKTIVQKNEITKSLEKYFELEKEIHDLMVKHCIFELQEKQNDLRKEMTEFCVQTNINEIEIQHKRAVLIQPMIRKWITTVEEITVNERKKVRTLQSLVDKKLFQKLTTRIADPDKIERAIQKGDITLSEIESAFVEIPKSPFLRFYDKDN